MAKLPQSSHGLNRHRIVTGLGFVALFCVWLAIRDAVTRERHEAWKWAQPRLTGGNFELSRRPPHSWLLTLFAEPPKRLIALCELPNDEKEDYQRHVSEIQRVFPEATVFDCSRWTIGVLDEMEEPADDWGGRAERFFLTWYVFVPIAATIGIASWLFVRRRRIASEGATRWHAAVGE